MRRAVVVLALVLSAHVAGAQGGVSLSSQVKKPAPAQPGKKQVASVQGSTMHAFFNCRSSSLEQAAAWIENDTRSRNGSCGLIPPADSVVVAWNKTFPSLHFETRQQLAYFVRQLHDVSAQDVGYVGREIRLERVRSGGSPDLNGWDRKVHPEEHFGCDASGECYFSLECGNPTPHLVIGTSSGPQVTTYAVPTRPDTTVAKVTVDVQPSVVVERSRSCWKGWVCPTLLGAAILGTAEVIACHNNDRWCVYRRYDRTVVNVNTGASSDRLMRRPWMIGTGFAIP